MRASAAAAPRELPPAPGAHSAAPRQLRRSARPRRAWRWSTCSPSTSRQRSTTGASTRLAALRALELDPRSQYPLFAAARVYAETADPARSRVALEFVLPGVPARPEPALALARARRAARQAPAEGPAARAPLRAALERHATARDVPLWAKQMEIFILEDMNELEAARIMLGGPARRAGRSSDPAELRFLKQRLEELEAERVRQAV